MENTETGGIESPKGHPEGAKHPEVERLSQSVREFLRGAEVGSSKLLAVADTAALYYAQANYFDVELQAEDKISPNEPVNPMWLLGLTEATAKEAAINETIRNRILTIPGYAKEYTHIHEASRDVADALQRQYLPDLKDDYATHVEGDAAAIKAASVYGKSAIAAELEREVYRITNPEPGDRS